MAQTGCRGFNYKRVVRHRSRSGGGGKPYPRDPRGGGLPGEAIKRTRGETKGELRGEETWIHADGGRDSRYTINKSIKRERSTEGGRKKGKKGPGCRCSGE